MARIASTCGGADSSFQVVALLVKLVSFKANMHCLNVWDRLAQERVSEFLEIRFDTKKINYPKNGTDGLHFEYTLYLNQRESSGSIENESDC